MSEDDIPSLTLRAAKKRLTSDNGPYDVRRSGRVHSDSGFGAARNHLDGSPSASCRDKQAVAVCSRHGGYRIHHACDHADDNAAVGQLAPRLRNPLPSPAPSNPLLRFSSSSRQSPFCKSVKQDAAWFPREGQSLSTIQSETEEILRTEFLKHFLKNFAVAKNTRLHKANAFQPDALARSV